MNVPYDNSLTTTSNKVSLNIPKSKTPTSTSILTSGESGDSFRPLSNSGSRLCNGAL